MKALSILLTLMFSTTLMFGTNAQKKTLPETNAKIIKYVVSMKEKKISRGECWDLIQGALNESGADWTPLKIFCLEILLHSIRLH